MPRSAFILSGSNGRTFGITGSGYTSTTPPTTSPAPISSMSWQALFIASRARFGSSPLVNLKAASVARLSLLDESLIFVPSKHAASNKSVLISSVTMEFSPPMIPAIPISFSPSQIISTLLSRVLSCPSRVVNLSPSFARRTTILLPAMVLKS